MRLRIIRLEANRLSIACFGFRKPAEDLQRSREIIVSFGFGTVQSERAANVLDCCIMTSDLTGNDAQQMPCVGMIRIDGDHLATASAAWSCPIS